MVYNALKSLALSLFPPTCVLCGADGSFGIDLCAGCRSDLPPLGRGCYRCGMPLASNGTHGEPDFCGQCLRKPPQFDRLLAPLRYEQPVDWLVQQLKFHARLAHVNVLSRLLQDHLSQHVDELPDVIVPVPLHNKRLRERGFNQALELARPLARQLRVPLAGDLCARQKDTPQQSVLPADQRRANLRNAFIMRKSLHGANVAIIDDVVTTGATVNALAKLLRQNGAQRVQVWSVARTTASRPL